MKRILILCNGRPPCKALFRQSVATADYLIAADGGGNRSRELGVLPDVVIGDLDSFEGAPEENFEVILQPEQDTNDLEKALSLAKDEGGTHVEVLGATGYRLDHTLKNLSVLRQFAPSFRQLRLRDDYGVVFLLPPSYQAEFPIGTQLSLFPLSGKVKNITTRGLKYPLNREPLENGVRDGSSNEVVANPVEITHSEGDLLLFVAQQPSGS